MQGSRMLAPGWGLLALSWSSGWEYASGSPPRDIGAL